MDHLNAFQAHRVLIGLLELDITLVIVVRLLVGVLPLLLSLGHGGNLTRLSEVGHCFAGLKVDLLALVVTIDKLVLAVLMLGVGLACV